MRNCITRESVLSVLQNGPIGFTFRDPMENIVEIVSDTDVIIGPGYNHAMAGLDYIAALDGWLTYGRYLLPEPIPFNPFAWA